MGRHNRALGSIPRAWEEKDGGGPERRALYPRRSSESTYVSYAFAIVFTVSDSDILLFFLVFIPLLCT